MKYLFIGWCKEGTHDKVWVCMDISGRSTDNGYEKTCLTVWGRRGKALQYKIITDILPAFYYSDERCITEASWTTTSKKIQEKIKKGYQSIDYTKLNEVYPEFETDLDMLAVLATLSA